MFENLTPEMEVELNRYTAAMHAVQSGVAGEMEFHANPTTKKHLRTGINSALVNCAAIGRLMIEKGMITELEYLKALADEAEAEKKRYQELLSDHYGKPVTLA